LGRNTHAFITGLFLLILLTGTAAIIYWLGNFEKERELYVISTRGSVSGLNPESTVFYRGIAVGKVRRVYFDTEDPLTILIPIEVEKGLNFTRGLYATLRLKGVTGLTQIDLQDAGSNKELLPPGGLSSRDFIPLLPSLADRLMDSGQDILYKAEKLMTRIDHFLSEENEAESVAILKNLNIASHKLIGLEDQLSDLLTDMPDVKNNAQNTFKNIDRMTHDVRGAATGIKTLSQKADGLIKGGDKAAEILVDTTLPKFNDIITELHSTLQHVKRLTSQVEDNPQAFILGPPREDPGPGEPGYQETP